MHDNINRVCIDICDESNTELEDVVNQDETVVEMFMMLHKIVCTCSMHACCNGLGVVFKQSKLLSLQRQAFGSALVKGGNQIYY